MTQSTSQASAPIKQPSTQQSCNITVQSTSSTSTPTTHTAPHVPSTNPTIGRSTIKISQIGPSIKVLPTATSEHGKEPTEPKKQENKPFAQEDITFQWHSYVEQMPVERRAMAMRMRGMMPKLINENTFEIVANNTQIGQYLLNMQDSILNFMRKALSNSNIQMSVRIAQAQEVQYITSKPALYRKMVEKNKNLQRLTELLGLEICN